MPGAELEALLAARDHQGVAALLKGLDEPGLNAARRWYRRTGRKQAREAEDDRKAGHEEAGTIVLLLAVALAPTGHDAARACGFTDIHWPESTSGGRLLTVLELAARRGPEWARDFVESASQVKVRRPWDVSGELVLMCLPLVDHHGLDVPSGPGYVDGWVELAVALQRPVPSPRWQRDVVRIDDRGHAAPVTEVRPEGGLVSFLRATPRLQQTLVRTVEEPGALGRLSDLVQPGWELEAGVRTAIAEGLLAREALVAAVLSTYTRSERPSEQRASTQLLTAAGFGPADAATRVPFLLQVLPTVHGAVTAALLPALLAAPLEPEDLLEVGSTILVRKEKAQKVVLLDRLERFAPSDPLALAAIELWRQTAALDDRTLAARAERALERLGAVDDQPDGSASAVAWNDPPAPVPAGPFRLAEPSAAGLARLGLELPGPLQEARWLDVVVRYAAADLEGLRRAVAAAEPLAYREPEIAPFLRLWAAGRPRAVGSDDEQPHGFGPLVEMLAAETLLRLGTPLTLLSTPSFGDGTLTFDDLVRRLREATTGGYGPVDLLQALLRLEPTSPDRLRVLDGLEVRPYDQAPERRHWWRRPVTPPDDAVGVVRTWVEGGGLLVRVAQVADGRAACAAVRLPAVPPGLAGHPAVASLGAEVPLGAPRTTWLNPDIVLGVVPSWSEAVAADHACSYYELEAMARAPGLLGPAVHLHAARLLGAHEAGQRLRAAEALLVAAGQRRLDPQLFARQSLFWCEAGQLPLPRTTEAWEHIVLGGGLAFLWPTLRAVLQHATTQTPKPVGLAELLRMLRPYVATIAANVPAPVWPDGVVALAGSGSASKSRTEARALVDALPVDSTR